MHNRQGEGHILLLGEYTSDSTFLVKQCSDNLLLLRKEVCLLGWDAMTTRIRSYIVLHVTHNMAQAS